ncbi:MYXO-CTERM sorting domain-containing protein [Vulgatibacter sp.]|uniref:MYXO-CTERM sorting domain-containing protein n=1 Tax=Vulgatibacter sp. TaxID=1971226 RepID=UPI0035619E89
MKRNMMLAAVAAVGLFAPLQASAGGVVIDGRIRHVGFFHPSWNGEGGSAAFHGGRGGYGSASASLGAGSSETAEPAGEAPTSAPTSSDADATFDAYEIEQIQAGLISEEEAQAGCGGASAATGPAGLLPLVVAAGALLRRRRKA